MLLQDFAEAEHAHEQFLHALVTQSFLGHQSLVVLFGEVFSHTTALCRLVRGAKERGIDWDQVKVRGMGVRDEPRQLHKWVILGVAFSSNDNWLCSYT